MTDTLDWNPTVEAPPVSVPLDDTADLFMTDRGDAPSVAPLCAFPGCENHTVKTSNKGPYPKFCPEHKNTDKTSGTTPRGTKTTGWKDGARVEKNLLRSLDFIALPTAALPNGSVLQQDALIVTYYMPQIIHELVVLAADDERLRRVLTRLAAPGKYGALLGAIGAMLLGIAANHGLLPPLLASLVASVNSKALGGEQ